MAFKPLAVSLPLVGVLLAPLPAGAYSMVALIETQTASPLDCGNPARGQEGTQVLRGLDEEFTLSPADTAGTPGRVESRPFVLIKPIDRCSPLLFGALVRGERLARVEVRLFDPRGVHFFTIRLEHVWVTRLTMKVRERGLHEEVALAFQVIHLIDELTGISAVHDFAG